MKREVERFSKQLPELSEYQINWAKENFHPKRAFYTTYKKHTKCYCSECGQPFNIENGVFLSYNLDNEKIECPHCHSKLKLYKGWIRKDSWYFTKFSTCRGFQVVRHFIADSYFRRNEAVSSYLYEAVQIWISPSGEEVIRSLPRDFFGRWIKYEPMINRRRSHYLSYDGTYDINAYFISPNPRFIPELKRNGLKSFDGSIVPNIQFISLLKEPVAEMLQKNNQFKLLKEWCYGYSREKISGCIKQIRICNRHNYIIDDVKLWLEHIDLLDRNGFDTHSPKYICPDNLSEEHQRIIDLVQRRNNKVSSREFYNNPEFIKDNEQYLDNKTRFFELLFSDNDIKITPLKSLWEFKTEGDFMHHCVFSNKYYNKDKSLILSAVNSTSKLRLETVEVSLQDFSIVQSRGRFNQSSPYHDRIVKLVNDNMDLIKAAAC